MEPVKTWINIFVKAWEDDDKEALTRILKDAPGYLQHVSKYEKETTLHIIFEKRKGLFKFMETVLAMETLQMKLFENPLKESFKVIQFIIDFFSKHYKPYMMQTKDVCIFFIERACSFDIKKMAAETLKKLIQLYYNCDMKLDQIIENYKEEKIWYIILGAIIKYSQVKTHLSDKIDSMYLRLFYDLQHQSKLPIRKQQKEEMKICLDCLSDMIEKIMPYKDYPESDYFIKLYNLLSLFCEPNQSQEITYKSICFLANHMKYFSSLVFKDYQKWHDLFNNIDENSSLYDIKVLKAFYCTMSLQLKKDYNNDVFLYFKNYFEKNLTNKNLTITKKCLILYGLGQFSEIYSVYSPSEVNEIFQKITYQTTSFFITNEDTENIQIVPYYLQALSENLQHMSTISLHHLNIVIELSTLIIEKFPQFEKSDQTIAIDSLKFTFTVVRKLEKNHQWQYFYSLFSKGICWICSHTLYIDIEIQEEIQCSPKSLISYKNYLPLWHSMFKTNSNQKDLSQFILNEFISVLILNMDRLNLNVKFQQNSFRSDVFLSLTAEKQDNFRYFINLIDLLVEILDEIEFTVLQNQVEKLTVYFITYSYKHPMVSGFYKIIGAILKKSDIYNDHEKYFSKFTCELISQYLTDVLQLFSGFLDELQLSCIPVIFNAPLALIVSMIDETIPVFEIALKHGLSDLSLAHFTLKTLENWSSNIKSKCFKDFYKNIFLYLEPYFENNESENRESLEAFQKKILQLYGSLEHNVLLDFIQEESLKINSVWMEKNSLNFKINCSDIYFEIHLDKYLQRVIELTEHTDRKLAFSACEFLHTIITIILGNKLTDQCFNENLYLTLLKLGCDMDDAVRNLFHPLLMQITRYLSSKTMIDSKVSQKFIDSLFEGLMDEFNPSLRDYCGVCLIEFQWTIHQSSENDPSTFSNFSNLVNRIINFAHYPSNNKRLAAAFAFNNLYNILKGSRSVINTYWLEFLYAFIKSLEYCNDIQIITAIDNVKKVIKENANILNAKSLHRRRLPEFSSETLKSAIMWLFNQCGSAHSQCRQKCMELFESLCLLIPGHKSAQEYIQSCGTDYINNIALKNLDENFEFLSLNNAKVFLKSLDFYTWIFNKKFASPQSIFLVEDSQEQNNIFFKVFNKFISIIVNQNIEDGLIAATNTQKETKELIYLLNKIILKIIQFVKSVLMAKEENLTNILEYFWTDDFSLMLYRFTLCPREIGLTSKTLRLLDDTYLKSFFVTILEKLPKVYFEKFQENFFNEKRDSCSNFVDIPSIINNEQDITYLKDFLRGITVLRSSQFIDFEKKLELSIAYTKDKITFIFEALKTAVINGDLNRNVEDHIKNYLKNVMKFFLLEYRSQLIEILVLLILYSSNENNANGTAVVQQKYFYNIFKDPMFECMMKNPKDALQILEESLKESPDETFVIIEDLLIFAQQNHLNNSNDLATEFINHSNDLATEVINKFNIFREFVGNNERTKDRFFNINRLAMSLKTNPGSITFDDGLYLWIAEEFAKTNNLQKKAALFESFLIYLTDNSNKQSSYLSSIFKTLREDNSITWREKLEEDEAKKSQAIQCMQVLLKMLQETKSRIVFEGIVRFATGVCSIFSKEIISNSLKRCVELTSQIENVRSLEMLYKTFKDKNLLVEERLDILDYFILPTIECCRNPTIVNFYQLNVYNLVKDIIEEIAIPDNSERKNIFVSKIGSYKILESIFNKVQFVSINFRIYPGEQSEIIDDSEKLKRLLLTEALNVRSLHTQIPEEKELMRLLHCAAFNCYIVIGSLTGTEDFYDNAFQEDSIGNHLIWERIIDCDRIYNFPEKLTRYSKISTNIRTSQLLFNSNFVEFDLNKRNDITADGRLYLNLEMDELNKHECMPTIIGTLMHIFNEIIQLPRVGEEIYEHDLPKCLLYIREAFYMAKDNVTLYVLKIISNARRAFLPYLPYFFESMAIAMHLYLMRNPSNYLIRDIIVILIDPDSKHSLRRSAEVTAAQGLMESLIRRAFVVDDEIYEYHIELITNLINLWKDKIKIPRNLTEMISQKPDLVMKIILILFKYEVDCANLISIREIHKLVRNAMFKWQEPLAPMAFEALGYIMQHITEDQREVLIQEDLVDLFIDIQSYSTHLCTRLVYLVFLGWQDLSIETKFQRFVNPLTVEDVERKAECYEILLKGMTNGHDASFAFEELKRLLRDRALPCINVGIGIIKELLSIGDSEKLLPFLEVIEIYTKKDALYEHKKIVYTVFMDTYDKYHEEVDDENVHVKNLLKLCEKVLIASVLDPNDELQEDSLDFWKEQTNHFPEATINRLLYLLKMFDITIHSTFAQFFCVLMLDQTKKSKENNKILFPPLSSSYTFEEYEIVATPQRRRKCGKKWVPLFTSSLASTVERAIIQQGSRLQQKNPVPESGGITGFDLLEMFARPMTHITNRVPDPSENKLSKRFSTPRPKKPKPSFLQSSNDRSFVDEYYKQLKYETKSQRDSTKINRRYRAGTSTYPDVEISQLNVITTLEDLILRDQRIANDLVVSIICAIVQRLKNTERYIELINAITETCKRGIEQPNDFAPVVMEIMLHLDCIEFNADNVMRIAKSMGLESLGILLLEKDSIKHYESINAYQTPRELTRMMNELKHHNQLANLYRFCGERDIASCIYENWTSSLELDRLRQGCLAEAQNDWFSAKDAYEDAYEIAIGSVKEYCLDGLFQSLSELSSWTEVNKKIDTILNNDYDSVWQNSQKNILLPWMFTSQLQTMLEDISTGKEIKTTFVSRLDDWIFEQKSTCTEPFGEELSVFYLCNKNPEPLRSQQYLGIHVDEIRKQWIRLVKSFLQEPKIKIFEKLGRINDINAYLKTFESNDSLCAAKELINYWEENSSQIGENLLNWTMRVGYRTAFTCMLIEKLKEQSMDSGILEDLLTANINHRMNITELAIECKNKNVSRKYYVKTKLSNQIIDNTNIVHRLSFINSCYKFLCGEIETRPQLKLISISKSWQLADELIKDENIDKTMKLKIKQHLFNVSSTLYNLMKDINYVHLTTNNDFITKLLNADSPEKIVESLFTYSYGILKDVYLEGNNEDIANSYTLFVDYCYKLISDNCVRNLDLKKDFITSVLTAMSLGSLRATRYFSCLLKYSFYKNIEGAEQLFIEKSKNIPSWMFIPLQEQITMNLVTPLASYVFPIVMRLANDFPNAIIYNIKMICNIYSNWQEDSKLNVVHNLLFTNSRTEFFFNALRYLCQPEQFLKYYLMELIRSTNNSEIFIEALDLLFDKVFNITGSHDIDLQGQMFKQVLNKYCHTLKQIRATADYETAKVQIKNICLELDESLQKRLKNDKSTNLLKLEQYTSYLANLNGETLDIEIPGQYNKFGKPLSQYHAKIAKFDHVVEITTNKYYSIKINMIGTDAKSYKFLVKFGKDMRQDQRMQQIFEILNETLRHELKCKRRYLNVNTYNIVPLSHSLSLVQWLNETKSFKELIEFSMKNKSILKTMSTEYQDWINKAAVETIPQKSYYYKQALIKYNAKDVMAKMKELSKNIEWDLFRKTFVEISPSIDCFIKLRRNFIKSYSTMCTVHWITGVGDRRLENLLLDTTSGMCHAIDFAFIFDTGIDQPIPELVPFRLTSQILGLLRPFGEKDLFGVTMKYVLSALRSEKNIILGCLDTFLHEPLNWNQKLIECLRMENEHSRTVRWLPKRKLDIVENKLTGAKPSHIMLKELSFTHGIEGEDENQYLPLYKQIVNGNEFHYTTIRSYIKNDDLTPEEQVKCLLDQAIDINILGRMSVEWTPFL